MQNTEKKLFQIGQVTKTLKITRRILLNYEELGLLTPAFRNDSSGFRYYSADNIVHIKLIRTLQKLGLSLSEIRDYFNDTTHLSEQINRLVTLRNELDQYIAQLRLRQGGKNELKIHHITLPQFTAFCSEFQADSTEQKAAQLRMAYIYAINHYQLDTDNKLCMQVSISASSEGIYIVPVDPESKGAMIRPFQQVEAICIYYRGPYENIPEIEARLLEYARGNGIAPDGYFRHIFMEGPPTHGANKDAYVTQIALPIRKNQ